MAHILTFVISPGLSPELQRTSFQNDRGELLQTSRSTQAKHPIKWGKGLRALTLFLVQYVGWSQRWKPEDFEWSGEHGSPAYTLDLALAQTAPIEWLESVFGPYQGGHSPFFHWVIRLNPEKRRKVDPVALKIRSHLLSPHDIHLVVGNREIGDAAEIEHLAMHLRNGWPGEQNLPSVIPVGNATGC